MEINKPLTLWVPGSSPRMTAERGDHVHLDPKIKSWDDELGGGSGGGKWYWLMPANRLFEKADNIDHTHHRHPQNWPRLDLGIQCNQHN
ncbi:MAG: hypothetical protein COA52_17105 [Hyphomicrobiales bacterium]|nr:MAG: hypothetical protein COA52_17105 [Hyphomicrobiales bacterium]